VKEWGLHRLAIGGCSGAGSRLSKEARNKEVAKLHALQQNKTSLLYELFSTCLFDLRTEQDGCVLS
jgi:hypothetical protein